MFEISLLVQLQIVRTGSKSKLRIFSSHVIIKISERNSAGSKTKRDEYASRDLSPPYSELDQKLYPRVVAQVVILVTKWLQFGPRPCLHLFYFAEPQANLESIFSKIF